MAIKSVASCDVCGVVISSTTPGIFVQGNIYMVNPDDISARGGVVGNNIETDVDKIVNVKETILCNKCFLKAINISISQPRDELQGGPWVSYR